MDGLTMEGFKDNSRGAMREGFDNLNQVIKAPASDEVKNTITVRETLNFTEGQYDSLGELLADNYKDLGDKLAKVFGMNSRKVAQALTNAMNNTPEKPKGLI